MIISYFRKDLDLGKAFAITNIFRSKDNMYRTFFVYSDIGTFTFDLVDTAEARSEITLTTIENSLKIIDITTHNDYPFDEILAQFEKAHREIEPINSNIEEQLKEHYND